MIMIKGIRIRLLLGQRRIKFFLMILLKWGRFQKTGILSVNDNAKVYQIII